MLHVLLALCTQLIFILNKFSPTLTLSQNLKIKKMQDRWFDSKFIAHCKSFQRVFFLQNAFSYFFAIFLLRGYLKYLIILFIEIMTLSMQNCSLYIKYTSQFFAYWSVIMFSTLFDNVYYRWFMNIFIYINIW